MSIIKLKEMAMPAPDARPFFNKNTSSVQASGDGEYYLITLPNTEIGIRQIKMLKDMYKGLGTLRLHGRHSNRKEVLGAKYRPGGGGRYNEIPWKDAEWIAVYLLQKK